MKQFTFAFSVCLILILDYFASDDARVVVDDAQFFGVSGINVTITGFSRLKTSYFYKIMYERDGNLMLDENKFNEYINCPALICFDYKRNNRWLDKTC
jgi:hypothetical protein